MSDNNEIRVRVNAEWDPAFTVLTPGDEVEVILLGGVELEDIDDDDVCAFDVSDCPDDEGNTIAFARVTPEEGEELADLEGWALVGYGMYGYEGGIDGVLGSIELDAARERVIELTRELEEAKAELAKLEAK